MADTGGRQRRRPRGALGQTATGRAVEIEHQSLLHCIARRVTHDGMREEMRSHEGPQRDSIRLPAAMEMAGSGYRNVRKQHMSTVLDPGRSRLVQAALQV